MRRHHIVGSPCRMQCHAACVLQAWFTLSEHIVRAQALPVRCREVEAGKGIRLRILPDLCRLRAALPEHLRRKMAEDAPGLHPSPRRLAP